jgi:hypothetical protein
MPDSWWDLGESSGYPGAELALDLIACPFCLEAGNFAIEHHAAKKKPNSDKVLNFDTLKCGNCASYVMVLWSASEDSHHDFRVLPRPLKLDRFPKHWPEQIGRFWLQAHRNLSDDNWDAATVMARSALQLALREHNAVGSNLKQEIEDLANKGELPPLMKDWSHHVRELGNDSAHPQPGQPAPAPRDARDIVQFLDFLLEYLYDLPHRIKRYRDRKDDQE